MKKKIIYPISIVVLLFVCAIEYFRPLSFTDIIGENHRIDIIINTFAIEDGKPEIESVTYDDIIAKQEADIFSLLENYSYRRTIDTWFSDGSITDIKDKSLSIFVYDDDSSVATILVGSSGKIAVNDKTYRMADGDQFIAQTIELLGF